MHPKIFIIINIVLRGDIYNPIKAKIIIIINLNIII